MHRAARPRSAAELRNREPRRIRAAAVAAAAGLAAALATPAAANNAATGWLKISGDANVGSTLTTTLTRVADADGLPAVPHYRYQWTRIDGATVTRIPGATGRTYVLDTAEAGTRVRVAVTFADSLGNAESLSSTVFPSRGDVDAACVDGILGLRRGETVGDGEAYICVGNRAKATCDDGWDDVDAGVACRELGYLDGTATLRSAYGEITPFSFHWTNFECTGVEAALRLCPHEIEPDCHFSERAGVRCAAVAGEVTIAGDPNVRSTLTATASITDVVGGLPASLEYGYQWLRVDGTAERRIPGADTASYTVTEDDAGRAFKVAVSFRNGAGHVHTLTSAATATVGDCLDDTIRLVRGETPSAGSVEVCAGGVFRATCDHRWDGHDAGVACREVGYAGGTATLRSHFGEITPVSYRWSEFDCTGAEAALRLCPHQRIQGDACHHSERAGVRCTDDLQFPGVAAERSVPENSPPGTAVGDPVHALGATAYALAGPDAAFFAIDAATGQIRTRAGVAYDYEARSAYEVTVHADDGAATGTLAVAISLEDVDPEAPAPTAVTVDDDRATLTFPATLDASSVPAASAFAVTVGAARSAVRTVLVAGASVRLTLARAAAHGEAARVLYAPPASDALQDAGGVRVGAFDLAAANETPDTDRPALAAAAVDGGRLTLTYSETLDAGSVPAPGAFAATLAGNAVAVETVEIDGADVRLRLASDAARGEAAALDYTVPASDPLRDPAGNLAAALDDEPVDNATATHGEVRLLDGPEAREGRLEVFHDGRWGTVCDDRMGEADNGAAGVACRLLGYEDGSPVFGTYGRPGVSEAAQPIWLDDLHCPDGLDRHGDTPATLFDCHHAGPGLHNCDHGEDVGVRCTGDQATVADTLGPGLRRARVDDDGLGVVLEFEETLDAANVPGTEPFRLTVTQNDYVWSLTAVQAPETNGLGRDEIRLTVDEAIAAGEKTRVRYADPSAGDDAVAVQDAHGNDAPSFDALAENPADRGGTSGGGGSQAPGAPVTATLTGPASHDGSTGFEVRLAFDAVLDTSWTHVRDALSVEDGTRGGVRRVDGRSDLWAVDVTPDGDADVAVRLAASPPCGDPGDLCTDDGRRVEQPAETTVPGPDDDGEEEVPLTVAFTDGHAPPAEHGGADQAFEFRLEFSDDLHPDYSYGTMRDATLNIWQGQALNATKAQRLPPKAGSRYWKITVTPINADPLTIGLGPTFDCADNGAVCTADSRMLSNALHVQVAGPTPSQGAVDGDVVLLVWPRLRDGFGSPAATDYAVAVNGTPVPVSAASLAGRAARLHLAAPVAPGDVVTAAYVGSAMHPLADATGAVRSGPWDGVRVVNRTGIADAPPPGPAAAPPAAARPGPVAAAAADARTLDASGLDLADLSGLVRLTALERLDLSDNAVADLSPLAALANLRDLDLSGNRVADLWPLAALGGLERLDLSGNRVADAAAVGRLANLTVLVLDGNAVADLWPLAHLERLEQLGLAGNAVADVAALQDLPALRRLDLARNPLPDPSPLGDVGTLAWLALPVGTAASSGTLGRLTRLRWVWARTGDGGDAATGAPADAR